MAANLNASMEELKVVVRNKYNHLPSQNSKTVTSYLLRFESLKGMANLVTSLRR